MDEEKKSRLGNLPPTKEITLESGQYIIGRPLMKHRREVAKIVTELQKVYSSLSSAGSDDVIVEAAKKMNISVEEMSKMELEDMPDDVRKMLFEKISEEEIPLEAIAEFQLEAIYICLKKAPFAWDPINGTAESIERNMEYTEGFQLLQECIPYIMDSVVRVRDRKK